MKISNAKRPHIFGATMVAIGMFTVGFVPSDAAVGAGCCMQRDIANDEAPWYQIGEDFDSCDELNRTIDINSDDIFEPAGLIWWNVDC